MHVAHQASYPHRRQRILAVRADTIGYFGDAVGADPHEAGRRRMANARVRNPSLRILPKGLRNLLSATSEELAHALDEAASGEERANTSAHPAVAFLGIGEPERIARRCGKAVVVHVAEGGHLSERVLPMHPTE